MPTVVTADGIALAAHELGGTGPDLLLAHATGFHGRAWLPVAAHLARAFRCRSWDMRGHGDSTVHPGASVAFDWPTLAGDALAVVDALGLRHPFGFGHSSGATVLLLAEAARPGTFAGLYCFEPIGAATLAPQPLAPHHPMAEQARRRRDVFPSRRAAEEAYRAKPPLDALAPAGLRAYVDHGFDQLDDGTVRLKCRPEHEARMYEHGFAHDAFARLVDVRCPVVLAAGASSPVVGPDVLERWAARLPSGRAEVLDGVGHLAPLEDPEAVASAVSRALLGPPGS